jgi:uncharacterized membrane protein YidH (DUF202 family)
MKRADVAGGVAPGAPASRDPGLQPERTALAWNRTSLAVVLNALLTLRMGVLGQQPVITALGVALLCTAALIVAFGAMRRFTLTSGRTPIEVPAWIVLVTCGISLLACAAGVIATITVGGLR